MNAGKTVTIIIDESITIKPPPPIELQALAARAVEILGCRPAPVSATIFRKPGSDSYWVSLMVQKKGIVNLFELKRRTAVVDFEIVGRAVSDIVSTGP